MSRSQWTRRWNLEPPGGASHEENQDPQKDENKDEEKRKVSLGTPAKRIILSLVSK